MAPIASTHSPAGNFDEDDMQAQTSLLTGSSNLTFYRRLKPSVCRVKPSKNEWSVCESEVFLTEHAVSQHGHHTLFAEVENSLNRVQDWIPEVFLLNKLVKWFAFNGLLFLFSCVLLFRTIMCPKFGEPLCTASDLETSEVLRTTFHGYD